mgnify:CR=1 FL=1
MRLAERKVITEAIKWWKRKKHSEWNEILHLKNPKINCVTESEKRLAESVVRLLKLK